MTTQEGIFPLSFFCCSPFGQSIHGSASKPPPTSTPFLGSPSGKLPQGFRLNWSFPGWVTSFLFSRPSKGNSPHCCLHAAIFWDLETTEKPFRDWKKVWSIFGILLLVSVSPLHCYPWKPFPTPLWITVSFLPEFSAFVSMGNAFLSLSTKSQEGRNWTFIHNWPQYGIWEAVGAGCGSRSEYSPELTKMYLPTKTSCCCHWNG